MITLLSLILACADTKTVPVQSATPAVTVDRTKLASFQPLPDNFFIPGKEPNPDLILLGRRLFFETQLSADANMSCSTCHNVAKDGADEHKFSPGHKMHPVGRNSPTVFNAAGQIAQFWDGRAATVEEQTLGPILAAGEMAMPDAETVVSVLKEDPTYVAEFTRAFSGETDPLNFQNVGVAIGAYERTLVTPAKWDEFLKGDDAALTNDEKRGLNTFMEVGCVGCHNGALLGGVVKSVNTGKTFQHNALALFGGNCLDYFGVRGRNFDSGVGGKSCIHRVFNNAWPNFSVLTKQVIHVGYGRTRFARGIRFFQLSLKRCTSCKRFRNRGCIESF